MGSAGQSLIIRRVPVAQDPGDVLTLVFGRMAKEERDWRLEAWRRHPGGEPPARAGLFEARRAGRLVGAVMAEAYPGRTALVWLPGLAPGEPPGTGSQLLKAASDWLVAQGVREAHILVEALDRRDLAVLDGGGFAFLTELLYLAAEEKVFPASCPPGPLLFVPREVEGERFAQVVAATYEGTLDCPELDGVRAIDEVLAGYRATGVYRAEWWLIARRGDEDVGCLIMADHPQHGNVELVYMGLKRPVRGRGWGRQMARHAQWLAAQAGRQRVVAAVDGRNWPAVSVYQQAGFQIWERRQVFLRVFWPVEPK